MSHSILFGKMIKRSSVIIYEGVRALAIYFGHRRFIAMVFALTQALSVNMAVAAEANRGSSGQQGASLEKSSARSSRTISGQQSWLTAYVEQEFDSIFEKYSQSDNLKQFLEAMKPKLRDDHYRYLKTKFASDRKAPLFFAKRFGPGRYQFGPKAFVRVAALTTSTVAISINGQVVVFSKDDSIEKVLAKMTRANIPLQLESFWAPKSYKDVVLRYALGERANAVIPVLPLVGIWGAGAVGVAAAIHFLGEKKKARPEGNCTNSNGSGEHYAAGTETGGCDEKGNPVVMAFKCSPESGSGNSGNDAESGASNAIRETFAVVDGSEKQKKVAAFAASHGIHCKSNDKESFIKMSCITMTGGEPQLDQGCMQKVRDANRDSNPGGSSN